MSDPDAAMAWACVGTLMLTRLNVMIKHVVVAFMTYLQKHKTMRL
jgi:hypothetical protein